MRETVAFIFGLGMVLNAALFVPQAIQLWRTKTAQGVSILSFAGFNTLQAIGALHGYFQGDHALMVGMLASLVSCGSVTALAICYTARPATLRTAEFQPNAILSSSILSDEESRQPRGASQAAPDNQDSEAKR